MDADSSARALNYENEADQDILEQQALLDENNAKLEQLRGEYENSLKHLYTTKAQEMILELQFESWKQLFRKQEAELSDRLDRARAVRQEIWRDRELFCSFSTKFSKKFSMESSLAQMRRADRMEDSPIIVAKVEPITDSLSSRMAEVEQEIEQLKLKEVDLEQREKELAPDEETIRRLQDAVNSSVSCLEDLEAEIKALEGKDTAVPNRRIECEVKSILKRPSFVAQDVDRKQVRFG